MTSDGTVLAAEVTGSPGAPALLLLNSIGSDRSLWDEQVAGLSQRYRILRFDTRGHGASDAPSSDYRLDRLGRDALELLDSAGVRRAHICGLSLGGLVAQWIAINAPERVDRLVLANTASRIGSAQAWEERRIAVLKDGLASIASFAMGRFFSQAFRADRPEVVARYRNILISGSVRGYAGCCAALRDADLKSDLGRIGARTLVIGGDVDSSTPPGQGRSLASAIGGGEVRLLRTGHLSNVEDPTGFTQALSAHLERP